MNYPRPVSMLRRLPILPTIYEEKRDAIKEFNKRFGFRVIFSNNIKAHNSFSDRLKAECPMEWLVNKK